MKNKKIGKIRKYFNFSVLKYFKKKENQIKIKSILKIGEEKYCKVMLKNINIEIYILYKDMILYYPY